MPKRPPDAQIPLDENLYRSICSDDMLGDEVSHLAVDVPRCSFNRSAYSAPEDVFTPSRPDDTGIAVVKPDWLPQPLARSNGAPLQFMAEDDPNPPDDPDNLAHCEVRVKPAGTSSTNYKIKDKAIRSEAQNLLARSLRVYKAPT